MNRTALYFEGPTEVSIRHEPIPPGEPGQVLVKTEYSAISAGTELLFYRDQIPDGMAADSSIENLQRQASYPLTYGYQAVGRIVDGHDSSNDLIDKHVFGFQPHLSHFWSHPADLILLPEGLELQDAVFLPNMETAVSLLHDGRPLLGEVVVVLGQGIVGLLTTALLAQHALGRLVSFDRFPMRRDASLELGADASFDPEDETAVERVSVFGSSSVMAENADLIFELTGNPQALDLALTLAGYDSRVIVGSWYGTKRAELQLGGSFHRDRIKIKSSQVSTIDPSLRGRWTKSRRLTLALEQLMEVQPSRLISHTFPIGKAQQAYHLLDQTPQDTLQVILSYREESPQE